MSPFQAFFDACVSNWTTERTYHYLTQQAVERSHTEFAIQPVTVDRKAQVLADNQYPTVPNLDQLPGYHMEVATVSDKGDRVNQSLSLLFVPRQQDEAMIVGDYLRDRAYEEA